MLSVTARKIREHGSEKAHGSGQPSAPSSRVYTGYLVNLPQVGRGMVIFRDPHGHRMITTPVKRVLREAGGTMLYVETDNSVYRLELHGEVVPVAIEIGSDARDDEQAIDITAGVDAPVVKRTTNTAGQSTKPAGE